jgi:DNA-directed RNA polymerase subunit RPC12/RpoP
MEARADPIKARKRLHLIFGLVYVIILAIAASFLLPDYWYLWLILVAIVLTRLISWSSKKQNYACTSCGATFAQQKRPFSLVPKAADLYESEKTIKCPKCRSSNFRMIEAKKRQS